MLRKPKSQETDGKAPGYDAWFRRQVARGIGEADAYPHGFIVFDDAVKEIDAGLSRAVAKAKR